MQPKWIVIDLTYMLNKTILSTTIKYAGGSRLHSKVVYWTLVSAQPFRFHVTVLQYLTKPDLQLGEYAYKHINYIKFSKIQ